MGPKRSKQKTVHHLVLLFFTFLVGRRHLPSRTPQLGVQFLVLDFLPPGVRPAWNRKAGQLRAPGS